MSADDCDMPCQVRASEGLVFVDALTDGLAFLTPIQARDIGQLLLAAAAMAEAQSGERRADPSETSRG